MATFNIHESMLYQLFCLLVNRPWFNLGGKKLAAVQANFCRCKLLIIDKKSMIRLKILHQINVQLYTLMACLTVF